MVDREALLNVFIPNAPAEDPEAFAGRTRAILDLTDALYRRGSVPIIFGPRGLGKTSLAFQLARIALGDVTLLQELKFERRAIPPERAWTVFWVDCSTSTSDRDAVLQRVINCAEMYSDLASLTLSQPASRKERSKIQLKVFEVEWEKTFDSSRNTGSAAFSVEERFTACVNKLLENPNARLLFVLDELDRVKSSSGLAGYIKNASSDRVKFCLVGIGHSISTLLVDHESLERSLFPVQVEPMLREELLGILKKASKRLQDEKIDIQFSEPAKARICQAAGGFPWFVHVLGQDLLLYAEELGLSKIESSHVELALERLATSRFTQQFSDLYRQAVGDSSQREIVLRLFAKWQSDDIPVGELYLLAEVLGVSNPSVHRTTLLSDRSGRILVAPPLQDKGTVRFRNAVFKRYVELRPSIFQGVKVSVDQAWRQQVSS